MENKEEVILGDFDPLKVHYINPKTGKLDQVKPFRCIAYKGVRFYEYPKSSGNLWFENRMPAGRLDDSGTPIRDKEHEVYMPKLTADQLVGQRNQMLEQENKKLMAEMADIKREQELDMKIGKVPIKETGSKVNSKKK